MVAVIATQIYAATASPIFHPFNSSSQQCNGIMLSYGATMVPPRLGTTTMRGAPMSPRLISHKLGGTPGTADFGAKYYLVYQTDGPP